MKKKTFIIAGIVIGCSLLGHAVSTRVANTPVDAATPAPTTTTAAVVTTSHAPAAKAAPKAKTVKPAPAPKAAVSTAMPAPAGSGSGISQGDGSLDASADVKFSGPFTFDNTGYIYELKSNMMVTNHSSKRSDYEIDLALVSKDGKTQYDTDIEFVKDLEPGQTATEVIKMFPDVPASHSMKLRLTRIQRTMAY